MACTEIFVFKITTILLKHNFYLCSIKGAIKIISLHEPSIPLTNCDKQHSEISETCHVKSLYVTNSHTYVINLVLSERYLTVTVDDIGQVYNLLGE